MVDAHIQMDVVLNGFDRYVADPTDSSVTTSEPSTSEDNSTTEQRASERIFSRGTSSQEWLTALGPWIATASGCRRPAVADSSTRHFHSSSARPEPVKPRSRSVLLRNSPILICRTKAEDFPCGIISFFATNTNVCTIVPKTFHG